MALTRDFVLSGLLQYNFLPTQKKRREELPPLFSSVGFSPDVARQLANLKPRGKGWDAVEYRLTRFNGVPRPLSIPHPHAYALFCLCICEHWDKLAYVAGNRASIIRPREYTDGRLIIMDYERRVEKSRRIASIEFAKRYAVHTDISNFFPSIYSHALPWALVGIAEAKRRQLEKPVWFNQLDQRLRWMKRNETQGVAIGPATSNIVAEAILAKIDQRLLDEGFEFIRFIDDYTAYCGSEDQAREFVRKLGEYLSQYNLLLNIKKTKIVALPRSSADNWVNVLSASAPQGDTVGPYETNNYFNLALSMTREEPDGSVLKFALRTLSSKKLSPDAADELLPNALAVSFHQPALLPILEGLFKQAHLPEEFPYCEQLNVIAKENARYRHSDGICWALYYLKKFDQEIAEETATEILNSRDCLSMLLLYWSGNPGHRKRITDFCVSLNNSDPPYELDQYWILLYQLFIDENINNPYGADQSFDVLKKNGVSFLLKNAGESGDDLVGEAFIAGPLEAEWAE